MTPLKDPFMVVECVMGRYIILAHANDPKCAKYQMV